MYKFYSYTQKIDNPWLLDGTMFPLPTFGIMLDIKMRREAQILSIEIIDNNEIIIRTIEDEIESEEIKKLIIIDENGSIPRNLYIRLKQLKTFTIVKMQNVYKEGMTIPSFTKVPTTYFLFEVIQS